MEYICGKISYIERIKEHILQHSSVYMSLDCVVIDVVTLSHCKEAESIYDCIFLRL